MKLRPVKRTVFGGQRSFNSTEEIEQLVCDWLLIQPFAFYWNKKITNLVTKDKTERNIRGKVTRLFVFSFSFFFFFFNLLKYKVTNKIRFIFGRASYT